MPSLIGNKPSQIPSNGDLGTLAFQDSNAVTLGGGNISGNFSSSGINIDSNTFVIDATNNRVGIGTSTPATVLEVYGATNSDQYWRTSSVSLYAQVNNTNATALFGTLTNHPLTFNTNSAERMRIDTSGNVGIGVSPAVRLDADVGNPTRGIIQRIRNSSSSSQTGAQIQFTQSGISDWTIGQPAATNAFVFWSGRNIAADGTERMRIDSSGNVGIGTSSPQSNLDVRGVNGANIVAGRTNNAGTGSEPAYFQARGPNASGTDIIWTGIRTVVNNATAGAEGSSICFDNRKSGNYGESMRLDSSGNLGLGVTPSAWGGGGRAFEMGFVGNGIQSRNAQFLMITQNTWYNSSAQYIYGSNGLASRYDQDAGTHKFYTAPSGTAGNPITFTQAMTLNASGNLGIGTTSPRSKADVYGVFTVGDISDPEINLYRNTTLLTGSGAGRIDFGGRYDSTNYATGAVVSALTAGNWSSTNYGCSLLFYTTAFNSTSFTERMRIDSSGNVGIGTTSPNARLDTSTGNIVLNSNLTSSSAIPAAGASIVSGEIRGYSSSAYSSDNGFLRLSAGGATNATEKSYIDLTGYFVAAADRGTIRLGTAGAERMRITSGGLVGIATNSPTATLDVNADTVRVRTARTPASATAAGNAGDICWDANYIYVCTATNTWKRAAIATW